MMHNIARAQLSLKVGLPLLLIVSCCILCALQMALLVGRAVAESCAHAVGAQTLGISATGTLLLVYLDVVMGKLHIYGAVEGCQGIFKN